MQARDGALAAPAAVALTGLLIYPLKSAAGISLVQAPLGELARSDQVTPLD